MRSTHKSLFGGALFSAGRGERPEHKTRGSGSRALAAALVATGTLVFVSPAQADTIHVPRDFETIQAAIDAAVDFDEIIVAPGEYVETIDFSGKTIVVRSADGRDVTTIDGDYAGTVVTCANGEGPGTTLDGFTVANGYAEEGAGMRNINSSPTVANCTFILNRAKGDGSEHGGGMFNQGSDVTIVGCVFTLNNAERSGGGCYSESSDMLIVDTIFDNNRAATEAGMYFSNGALVMDRCQFLDNNAGYCHGALSIRNESTSIITNCLFNDNEASEYDAAVGGLSIGGKGLVANCTFTDNHAQYCWELSADADVLVTNCIIDDANASAICTSGSNITYSLVPKEWEGKGQGNITGDPQFVDPVGGDFRLAPGSPGIDAGNNAAVPRGVELDLDGNPRFLDDFDTKDTGLGRPPIVDMGAYEFQGVTCLWDLDGDGVVGTGDLILLLGSWGDPYGAADLVELLGNWGACP